MVERHAVFNDEDTLHLTEHAQDPELMSAISVGCTLSLLHTQGLVHGDLYGSNSVFNWHTGEATLVDLGAAKRQKLNPDAMAADFLVPRVRMGFTWCQALLAGYVKIGRLSIDPVYPGYCDDLLDLLGGSVESDPRPRTPTLPAETLSDTLSWLNKELLPTRPPDRFWLAPTSPAQCAFIIGGLIAGGIDCSALASDSPARTPGHEAIRSLVNSAISQRAAPASCPAEVPQAAWDFITHSLSAATASAPRAAGSAVRPDTGIFRTITQLRDTWPQRELEEMVCAFMDVCDWLAAQADSGTSHAAKILSIQLAQLTYMFLQLVYEPAIVESAELTAARRHALLSWYPALVDGSAEVADEELGHLYAYANSRVSTYRQMFQGEGPDIEYGRPWTANWRATSMARIWFGRLLARRLAHETPHRSPEFLDQVILFAAYNLDRTLRGHARTIMMVSARQFIMMSPQEKKQIGFEGLQEEIDAVQELFKIADSREPGAPVAPDYANLAREYIARYSHMHSVPFDDKIAR